MAINLDVSPSLYWGDNFENRIDINILDNLRTFRRPREGGAYGRDGAGAPLAWSEGWDYAMAATVRWVPRLPGVSNPVASTQWAGPVGVQAFVAWCLNGNAFRYAPDRANPLFYVDGCVLLDPVDDMTPDIEPADGTFKRDIMFINPGVDFGLANRGVMFEFAAGADLTTLGLNAEDVRAQTASYTDAAVGVKSVAANVPRAAYTFLGAQALVVEPPNAKANVILYPEDFTQAIWTNTGPPTLVTADGLVSPISVGDLVLTLVKDTSAGAQQYVHQAIPATPVFTSGGIKGWGFFAKKGTSAISSYTLFDETDALHRCQGDITWNADGTVASVTVGNGGTGTATKLGNYHVGGGVYLFLFQTASGLLANKVNAVYLYPAGTTAANTGSTYFGGAFICDAAYPGSYRKNTGTISTRTGDAFRFRIPQEWSPRMPQAMYVKFINHGQLLTSDFKSFFGLPYAVGEMGQWSLNCDNTGGARKFSGSVGGHGAVTPEAYCLGVTATDGDTIELMLRVVLDTGHQGHAVLHMSINGAAETTGSSSTIILPAKWDHPTDVQVGVQDVAGSSAVEFFALQAFKWVAGSGFDTIAKARSA